MHKGVPQYSGAYIGQLTMHHPTASFVIQCGERVHTDQRPLLRARLLFLKKIWPLDCYPLLLVEAYYAAMYDMCHLPLHLQPRSLAIPCSS